MSSFHPHLLDRRLRVARAVVWALMGLIVVVFFRTQILEHGKYRLQSEMNRLRPIPLLAPRGLIMDRNGKVLAENVPGYTVSLLPGDQDSLRAELRRLAPRLRPDSFINPSLPLYAMAPALGLQARLGQAGLLRGRAADALLLGRALAALAGAAAVAVLGLAALRAHPRLGAWPAFLFALLCLVIGVGMFKGNIASQVGSLYQPEDLRRADAFQIFYLGINAGVILSPLIVGTLGETVGWRSRWSSPWSTKVSRMSC